MVFRQITLSNLFVFKLKNRKIKKRKLKVKLCVDVYVHNSNCQWICYSIWLFELEIALQLASNSSSAENRTIIWLPGVRCYLKISIRNNWFVLSLLISSFERIISFSEPKQIINKHENFKERWKMDVKAVSNEKQ